MIPLKNPITIFCSGFSKKLTKWHMHIPIHTVDKKICIRFLKIFFLKKYFFIYISWISITIDSAVIVPYAAPDAPHFGIKIKLIVVFITAPIHTAIKEIFSFLNVKGKIFFAFRHNKK